MIPIIHNQRRAVIDVGTNSVKLLVADVAEGVATPILETSEQTRLGRGFYETHLLQPSAIADTAKAVAHFAEQARDLGAEETRPFATSAARDAGNAQDLVQAIRDKSGLDLKIISGEIEAEWAFRGATTNLDLADRPMLLMDVGGGSTEFILGQGGHRHFSRSFPLGTVRTIEGLPHSDPPTAAELKVCREHVRKFIAAEVLPVLSPAMRREQTSSSEAPLTFVGTGGTSSILAAMELKLLKFDRNRIESVRFNPDLLTTWVERLWSLPLEDRRRLLGLPPSRADVILAGAVIFERVMLGLGFLELRTSTRGLRFAALTELWCGEDGVTALKREA